jgi:hypothetical protein
MKMKFSKLFLFVALASILALFASGPGTLAMEGGGSSSGPFIGPELWAVVVTDATAQTATLRVKKIEDCTVSVQAEVTILSTYPTQASDALYQKLTGLTLFGITNTPVITKVKNFSCTPPICSFDAQIKFEE